MKDNELYEILNNFKSKGEAYKYFNICPNSYGILKLKKIANSVNFDLNIYSERKNSSKKFCKQCNNKLNNNQYKFCSHSCSAKFSNSHRILSEETKNKIKLTILNKKLNAPVKIKCCKICGQEICKNKEICKHMFNWFNNLICFGFNNKLLGTINVYQEYYKIKDLILKEYFDNNLSPNEIAIKYQYDKKFENILHILKSFGIKTRNLSESGINACLNGRLNSTISNNITKYQFKHGWHETWNLKKIYYRSSYELNFAKMLDNKKIDYEIEYFRIKYWDSQKYKYRVAIPDFYIPSENKIIEIKSKFTFNKQNIIDKFNEYIKMNFSVSLIYENKEYSFNELLSIKQHKCII
jgi:hypothetical protein